MKDCESCKWDVKSESQNLRMIQCGQGHARTFQKTIEECHAWKEKEKCWCEKVKNRMVFKGLDGGGFEINPSKVAFCPWCSRKLED